MILTVTLNPAIDVIIRKRKMISAGGKGINVARALKALGIPVMATGVWGGKTAVDMKQLLGHESLRADFVRILGETRTNVTDLSSGSIKRTIERGPEVTAAEMERFKLAYQRLLKKLSIVVLSGRNAYKVDDRIYAQLIRLAKKERVPCVLDSHGLPFRVGIQACPWVIKPNLKELEELLQERCRGKRKMKQAIEYLHDQGIKIVLLTLGEKGAVGSLSKEMIFCQAPFLKKSNDVGCGDAFLAGFLYAQVRGFSFEKSLQAATAAGAANVMNMTPGLISRKNVLKLMARVRVSKF